MNKKILFGLIIVILIVIASAGCFENKPPKSKKDSYVESTSSSPPENGWLDSTEIQARDGDKIYVDLDATIPVFLNETSIYSITLTLMFEDYDAAHSGTDGNSPPDEVTVSSNEFNVSSSGTTPCTIILNIMGNETDGIMDYISPEFSLEVTGRCFCEITYPMTNRPSALNLYTRDLGVAYQISATYDYHDYGEE